MKRSDPTALWPTPRPLTATGKRWFDFVLATLLLVPAPLQVSQGSTYVLISIALLVPLYWRRTHPVASSAAVLVVCLVQVAVLDLPVWGQVGLPITVYSVARYAPAWWTWATLVLSIAGAGLGALDWLRGFADGGPVEVNQWFAYFLTNALIALSGWMLGALNRTRAAYVDAVVERSRRVEHEAAQQAELAAMDERTRIAREMHDVVAHGLSVMVVQADGARYAAPANPDAVGPALETIAATGRQSLADMRQLLGLLREDAEAGTRPLPGLAEVPWLLAQAEAAGTPITATLPDPLPQVPPTVGLTCYRLVQEALTNVRKHAGADAAAVVRLASDGRTLRLEITDDGHGASAPDDGSGLGLSGMRERVGAVGGELRTGPTSGGGFEVAARIPVADDV